MWPKVTYFIDAVKGILSPPAESRGRVAQTLAGQRTETRRHLTAVCYDHCPEQWLGRRMAQAVSPS